MTDHKRDLDFDQQRNSSDQQRHRTTFDPETDTVSEELVEAVAAFNDADPDELAILADFIDPDALDALFRPRPDGTLRNTNGRVRFEYDDAVVRIQTDGKITLRKPSPPPTE
jgi:hypothetical protein